MHLPQNFRSRSIIGGLAVLMLLPLVVVITSPFHASAPEWDHVMRDILPSHLLETLRLVGLTVLLALLFAIPSAWMVSTLDFPGRRLFRWALVLPLALPTYICAITFGSFLGPTGAFSRAISANTGIHIDIMTWPGLSLVLALALFPYIYLPARVAFSAGMSPHLDAARMLGGGAWKRFFRVAMPLARPAIAGGALLVAMETLNDYGAVKYYGVRTLTAGIFRSWGGLYDVGSALRLSGVLLLLVISLITLERSVRRRAGQESSHRPVTGAPLYGWKSAAAVIWCIVLFAVAFLLPVASIALDAFRTMKDLRFLQFLPALGNTLLIGLLAALATILIAVAFAFAERSSTGTNRLTNWASIGYVVPGAVIAIGVMAFAGWLTHVTGIVIIGSIVLMVYAFSVRFLALASQPLRAGLKQQPKAMDEAAHLLGSSPWRTFRQVNLPLLRPAIIAAALLVLMEVVKELPLTLILRPFNFDTLSTKVFELARIEQWPDAGVPALLIVLCGLFPVLVLDRLLERRTR
ncbi:MAG: iron ABC transporter permease [Flavobacteriales bacterium]|nr:iron ABC transporter permease [Flavobacteriales bacterium]